MGEIFQLLRKKHTQATIVSRPADMNTRQELRKHSSVSSSCAALKGPRDPVVDGSLTAEAAVSDPSPPPRLALVSRR